jgi:ribosome-associated protein
MNLSNDQIKDFILSCLDEKQADNISCLLLKEQNPLCDWMIIATGRSLKNIQAIADYVSLELKHQMHCGSNIEGMRNSEWILVDTGGVVLHLFHPEAREQYKLEELWGNSN